MKSKNKLPSEPEPEPELFHMEQVLPVMVDNEFNADPFDALPSNLQFQH